MWPADANLYIVTCLSTKKSLLTQSSELIMSFTVITIYAPYVRAAQLSIFH